jgi:hypothetical protein
MDAAQRTYLEKQYRASEWHGRSQYPNRTIKGFAFTGSEVRGWKILRTERDERANPSATHSFWIRSAAAPEILSIDLWECSSIKSAHDALLEALANMQSGEIERRTGASAPGDVAFALKDTMVLFARVNLAVLIRNAGPKVVSVVASAVGIDAVIVARLESGSRKKR